MTLAVPAQPTSSLSRPESGLHVSQVREEDPVTITLPRIQPDPWCFTEAAPTAEWPVRIDQTTPTEDVAEHDRSFEILFAWMPLVSMLPQRRSAQDQEQVLGPAEAVERIRMWTGLSVTDIANLLGVARRSLYHWSTGATRPRHQDRLVGLARAIQSVSRTWEPWELRQWLMTPGVLEVVRSGDVSALGRLMDEAVRPSAARRLGPARPGHHEELAPLEADAIRRQFETVTRPRTRLHLAATTVPRELTDSPQLEEE